MKNSRILLVGITIIASAGLAAAQGQGTGRNPGTGQQQNQQGNTNLTSDPIPKKFWEVSLADGGAYMVALSRITSIAKHEYIVDGAVRVNEFTITAEGSTIIRFYYLAPVTDKSPSSAGQAVIDRVTSASKELAKRTNTTDHLEKVAKSYPHATHTHNVEFRLKSLANVNQLYSSAHHAWYEGKGTRVSIRNKK